MKLGAVKEITKARLRHQLSKLISAEFENMQAAFAEVRKENPKVYIDQVLAAAEFALPKMKAVEIERESESGRQARDLSMDELMRLALDPPAPEDVDVVSVQ